jgi:hypothetical protein
MKFVWLDVPGGGAIPINPDQVAYLRNSVTLEGQTQVVFGAVPGGLHSVAVLGDGREVAEKLEAAPEPPWRSGVEFAEPIVLPAGATLKPGGISPAPKAKGPPKRTALKRGKGRA